jgi:hypothetical protein
LRRFLNGSAIAGYRGDKVESLVWFGREEREGRIGSEFVDEGTWRFIIALDAWRKGTVVVIRTRLDSWWSERLRVRELGAKIPEQRLQKPLQAARSMFRPWASSYQRLKITSTDYSLTDCRFASLSRARVYVSVRVARTAV